MSNRRILFSLVSILILAIMLVSACGQATTSTTSSVTSSTSQTTTTSSSSSTSTTTTAALKKLPPIKFSFNNAGLNPTIAQFLQGQMKDNLGIEIVLDPMESKALTQLVNAEQHQWAWFGWGADYPDPDNWLPDIFGTGGGNNHTLYSNPAFDALATKAKQELDNTKRLQMWADAQKMVMADAPVVTMFYQERFWVMKPSVQGLTTTGMDGQIPGDQFYTKVAITPSTAPQVFTTNLSGEPATIDPNKASWADQRSALGQCFEGVLGFDKDLNLIAVTATEIPTVANGGISSDGLTYTFKLRPEVTWSDGQKVLAKDYVYGIKRMLSPEVASEYAGFYYDIVGAQAYNGSADKDAATQKTLKDAVAVTAINDYTLKIKLAQPRPTFPQIMALWPAYPTREDVITKYGDKWTEAGNYIGNGPFILTEWAHQDHMTFKPNPNYWGTKPKLTQLTYKMIADANAALAAYKNNELQLVQIPAGTEKATLADPVMSKEILRYNLLTTFAFQFNVTKAPFDNLKVRQAISCAVDRAAFVDKVRSGVGKVALSWIPPGMPGYDPNLGKEYEFNPTKAKQLLTEAGYMP
jgi:oligopeptide transport system substrate-binding protein